MSWDIKTDFQIYSTQSHKRERRRMDVMFVIW